MPDTTPPAGHATAGDRPALIALAVLTEPGTRDIGALVHTAGAADALARIVTGRDVHPLVTRHAHDRLRTLGVALPRPAGAAAISRLAWDLTDQVTAVTGRLGARIVTSTDDEWPAALRTAGGAAPLQVPFAVWLRGPLRLTDALHHAVAVTGARAMSEYGAYVASQFGYQLAEQGWTVVSDGSLGIASVANQAALTAAGGVTAAVTADGLDRLSPAANTATLERLGAEGLLVSVAAPGVYATRAIARSRNWLVAAATAGTVLVEAGRRSTARQTLGYARMLGRAAMAVPGPITSAMSAGTHLELRHPGTTLVTDTAMVIDAVTQPAPPTTAAAGGAGGTVYLLRWDQAEDGVHCFVLASRAGAERLRDTLIREYWYKVARYSEVPAVPPSDAAAALTLWHDANEEHADPDVGSFTIEPAQVQE
ncbi:DNA-processing protein DprA [Dactylosporangium matsuzakiense]|uniref:DNA processing protein DprA n=1 Tax=Dactylosporangium matsuzakiense TaxID=53360 RepID=A0A9W6KNT8_9ACTN|nr:DNA-processing protein DprA [Dactylosporangium matsuzakiense]GLL03726.1 DNA processing protein DprA [Dactylosporangium matsuzakiense]